jgi:tRNA pseudouridine65 synthase
VHRSPLDPHEQRIVQTVLRDQLGRWVYPVHRLDKGTSGVLVLALDADTARTLSQAFEARTVAKRYVAMVRGWPPESAHVDHALVPDEAPHGASAQPAQTAFVRLATLSLPIPVDRYPSTRAALVLAEPHTGRRHQIRRHLKHLAHPIIGDATHGKGPHNRLWAQRLGQQRLWLHAWQLSLPHPTTGEALTLTSPLGLPLNADWCALLQQWPWQVEPAQAGCWTSLGSLQAV